MSKTKILNELVKMVCEKEKGKKQLDAGQAREVIKVISKLGSAFFIMLGIYAGPEKENRKK